MTELTTGDMKLALNLMPVVVRVFEVQSLVATAYNTNFAGNTILHAHLMP